MILTEEDIILQAYKRYPNDDVLSKCERAAYEKGARWANSENNARSSNSGTKTTPYPISLNLIKKSNK